MSNCKLWRLVFCLGAALGLTGCSLDYQSGEEGGELSATVPDVVFNNFVHTAVNGEKVVFQLEAEQARMFNKNKVTYLTRVRFVEYDDRGAISLEGRAANAIYHTDTENADLSGGVYGYSAADKVSFTAATLTWQKDERLLHSEGQEIVRIDKDDGSFIEGMFFTVDAARKTLTFNAAVRGSYVKENDTADRK